MPGRSAFSISSDDWPALRVARQVVSVSNQAIRLEVQM